MPRWLRIPARVKAPFRALAREISRTADAFQAQRVAAAPKSISETSKVRASLAPFCAGDGIDVGFGGDPILPSAIAMDLPERYARYLENPQHLHGDASKLHWFRDGVLDYVFSSHVLEDFQDTAAVLREWLRVLKPGGRLVLFLPDEQTYRAYCAGQGKPPNAHHVHANFGPEYLKSCLPPDGIEIEHERFPVGIYSFEMVVRKTTRS
jgi:SAM-dependent methyltransferase